MYSDHPSSSPVPSRESSPSTTPVDTPESSPAALDSDEPSSAADPLLGGSCDGDSCELAHMGKGKDDTSLGSADEVEHLEVAPIHHGAAVWESRDTYGPTGTPPVKSPITQRALRILWWIEWKYCTPMAARTYILRESKLHNSCLFHKF